MFGLVEAVIHVGPALALVVPVARRFRSAKTNHTAIRAVAVEDACNTVDHERRISQPHFKHFHGARKRRLTHAVEQVIQKHVTYPHLFRPDSQLLTPPHEPLVLTSSDVEY